MKENSMPEERVGSWIRRLFQRSTLKSIHEGLGVELVRDLIKTCLTWLGTAAFAVLVSGLGNLTWSLTSFNLFGAVNAVENPNQKIGSEAVYRVPFDTSVRLEGGSFLAISRGRRSEVQAVLTNESGEKTQRAITPTSPMFAAFGCVTIGVQLMELPTQDATSALILYTTTRIDSEKCQGFWNYFVN